MCTIHQPEIYKYTPHIKDGKPPLLNREEYLNIVRENRKMFIETNFKSGLDALAKKIFDAATYMEECKFEVTFDLPSHSNSESTVRLLSEFISEEYGYTVARVGPVAMLGLGQHVGGKNVTLLLS